MSSSGSWMRDRRLQWLAVCAAVCTGLAGGCGSSSDLVPVSGRVTVNGRPLAAGSVTFQPDAARGNTSQDIPVGMIADGKYELATRGRKGASPGAYRVVVVATNFSGDKVPPKGATAELPRSLIPLRYGDPSTTPLSKEVTPQAADGAYDLLLSSQ